MDWTQFSEDLINGTNDKSLPKNAWMRTAIMANPNLLDEANAKNHFSIQKSGLQEVLENVYFPVVNPQEHVDMYSQHDMAINQQHKKLVDTFVIELITLTQILNGLNDKNELSMPECQKEHHHITHN